MRWAIVADFFQSKQDVWLDDFISCDSIEFQKIVSPFRLRDWHQAGPKATLADWIRYFLIAGRAFRGSPNGIITCFPQLTIAAGVIKRFCRADCKIVGYNFNLGGLPEGIRRRMARFAARVVDRFVVHSPLEVVLYAQYLDICVDRFQFVPLQRPQPRIERQEELSRPFLLAMGSAHRDYDLLIRAVRGLGIRTVIVAGRDIANQLERTPDVEVRSGLTYLECERLLSAARICVVPIKNDRTASGQITFIAALHMGVPVVARRCPGTEGYLDNGHNAILVEPDSVEDMRGQIVRLWKDCELRARLAVAGRRDAMERFSDSAAGTALLSIIQSL
jgi:glycosyltransferase involved in cell wall biosynthesis